jgi:hypothetical protein
MKTISQGDLVRQLPARSIKTATLPSGATLNFVTIRENTYEQNGDEVTVHSALYRHSGGLSSIPVAELSRMVDAKGNSILPIDGKDEDEQVSMPQTISVKKATTRKQPNGEPQFPLQAFEKWNDFISNDVECSYNDLVDGGLKEDHGYEPMKDYVVQTR